MRYSILLLCLLTVLGISSQTVINERDNRLRSGDVLLKALVGFDGRHGGRDVIWDMSDSDIGRKRFEHSYVCIDSIENNLCLTATGSNTYYRLSGHDLLLCGYENNMYKIDYETCETKLHYPFCYGDSIFSYFNGIGTYCDKSRIHSFGYTKTVADGCGSLILPNNDTLINVLRVHTVRQLCNIFYDINNMQLSYDTLYITNFTPDSIVKHISSSTPVMRIDIYSWYQRGYRYPLVEQIIKTYGIVEHSECYYFPPEEQTVSDFRLSNPFNHPANNHHTANAAFWRDGDISMSKDNNKRKLIITFEFEIPEALDLTISDLHGIPVQGYSYHKGNDILHSIIVDCTSMKSGLYILRIQQGEQTFSKKFVLKDK